MMKMRYMTVAILSLFAFASVAVAGPAERAKKKEAEAEIAEAQKAFKKACECDLKFDVKWDQFKTTDSMQQIYWTADSIERDGPTYCADPDSKKAICAMKTIVVTHGKESSAAFKG